MERMYSQSTCNVTLLLRDGYCSTRHSRDFPVCARFAMNIKLLHICVWLSIFFTFDEGCMSSIIWSSRNHWSRISSLREFNCMQQSVVRLLLSSMIWFWSESVRLPKTDKQKDVNISADVDNIFKYDCDTCTFRHQHNCVENRLDETNEIITIGMYPVSCFE